MTIFTSDRELMKKWYLKKLLIVSILIIGFFSSVSALTENRTGSTIKDTQLRSEPKVSAQVIAELRAKTALTLIQRRGGWYQVELDAGGAGWIKMLSVQFDNSGDASSANVAELINLQSSNSSTQVSGVRGMGREELKPIEKSAEPVVELQQFIPTATEIDEFSEQGELQEQAVEAPQQKIGDDNEKE